MNEWIILEVNVVPHVYATPYHLSSTFKYIQYNFDTQRMYAVQKCMYNLEREDKGL